MAASDEPDWPRRAESAGTLRAVDDLVVRCRACPRLVEWREKVGREKRKSFAHWTYWSRAVPSFGDSEAAVIVVGLAPAAHGGNRTGRMFTGDQSGDVLYAALHRTGFANQPTSTHSGDGMVLTGVRLVAPVHCAPPENKPTPEERNRCAPFLARELDLLAPTLRVAVVLGGFGWQALLTNLAGTGWQIPRPRPKFGHGADARVTHPDGRRLTLVGCYHPSQHNTFTGRLTPDMIDTVLRRARSLAEID
ncbi:uracil-DNA glycosylase [Hoyosella altamirensis]|uniref:Type-5 uracil-DNA glycosylase n=1 Tax=Hoyosella altamirensis TaxID=616997 RepID=A0A839RKH0_9ACTN|nr:uracil-DNA glycosylase [Hoyosella altamirensis]MBB3036491.1 uracil-DNA glycosylase family 4 [Hoyosella altamirensis]